MKSLGDKDSIMISSGHPKKLFVNRIYSPLVPYYKPIFMGMHSLLPIETEGGSWQR